MTKSNRTKWILLTLILVGLLFVVVFGFRKGAEAPTPTTLDSLQNKSGQIETNQSESKRVINGVSDLKRLSKISLTDYSGNTKTLEDFDSKILVVNSWAVWCPFCKKELPDFSTLQKAFPDEITVIAIDRAESLTKVKGYTDGLGISDDMVFLLDKKDDFYKNIGGFSMPETVFINSKGAIVFHKRGPMSLEEMKEQVEKLLVSE